MKLQMLDEVICADYRGSAVADKRVELIAQNTENTWQEGRKAPETEGDTRQGKLAEDIVQKYMQCSFRKSIGVLSYDEIRNDAFRKTAPFDFLFWKCGEVDICPVIDAIRRDVQACERFVVLSAKTRRLCQQLSVKIVEIKSTRIRPEQKKGADFDNDYKNAAGVRRLMKEIKQRDDFLTYHHYCRKTEKMDYSMTDYCRLAVSHNTGLRKAIGEGLQKQVIANELGYQSDVFIRVYLDCEYQVGFIIGWLSKELFIDEGVMLKKMPKKGKSEKALYFSKNLMAAKPMSHIDEIFEAEKKEQTWKS